MATYSSQQQMDQAYMDQSRQDLHVVKCVVVGDTGTGKTRLICARASGNTYTLQQLMVTHVPTVWAIDHYRKDRQALEQSWCTVDGIRVSLRLWDTFGYHDKDRRFAYGRADVILLTFSLTRPRTLRNVLQHWYGEIRRLCPGVPIVLCGCQADLRYLYRTTHFQAIDKGPFFREITDADIITPDEGRAVAGQIGAHYYETSVLEPSVVHDVFANVVRAALTWKRDKHFWHLIGSGLKRMHQPLPQKPLKPPRPPPPPVHTAPTPAMALLEGQAYCDVIFVVRGVCMAAHRAYLIAAAPVFHALFLADLSTPVPAPHSSSSSHCNDSAITPTPQLQPPLQPPPHDKDTLALLDNEEMETVSLCSQSSGPPASTASTPLPPPSSQALPKVQLQHAAFSCIELQQCDDVYHPGARTLQTVVTLHDNITATAFQHVLVFLYTGRLDPCLAHSLLHQIHNAAHLIGLPELVCMASNIVNGEDFLNRQHERDVQHERNRRIHELLIHRGLLSDVLFQVDDGNVAAHKALLMARCDVMAGMFSYNFRESSAKVIQFPGVSVMTFVCVQEYLYTGVLLLPPHTHWVELVELADRLCLQPLLALTEHAIVTHLTPPPPPPHACREDAHDNADPDAAADPHITDRVLTLLQPAQLHNASQLTAWCLWYLATHYTAVYKKHSKIINSLRPENQIYLCQNRWPPLWYLKEVDYYEKCVIEGERQKQRALRTYIHRGGGVERRDSDSDLATGCLGFCSRNKPRKTPHTSHITTVLHLPA